MINPSQPHAGSSRCIAFLLVWASLSVACLNLARAKETAGLMPLILGEKTDEGVATAVFAQWQEALAKVPDLSIMDPPVVSQLITLKKVKVSDPCLDADCLAAVGKALDVTYVMAVQFKQRKDKAIFGVTLADTETGSLKQAIELEIDPRDPDPTFQWILGECFPREAAPAAATQAQKPGILDAPERLKELAEKAPEGMVYVPSSAFLMGSDAGERDESPRHLVVLTGFFIDRQEVTNRQYEQFVQETGYRKPECWKEERLSRPDQPVVGVSWEDAQAYARWAEKRLPTEAEWERAAAGVEARTYPWGEDPLLEKGEYRCNLWGAEDRFEMTAPVGSFPLGVSPEGCMDMAGNAWEWVSSLYRPYPYDATDGREDPQALGERCLRGGCWIHANQQLFRCSIRNSLAPDTRGMEHPYLGFRCARTP